MVSLLLPPSTALQIKVALSSRRPGGAKQRAPARKKPGIGEFFIIVLAKIRKPLDENSGEAGKFISNILV